LARILFNVRFVYDAAVRDLFLLEVGVLLDYFLDSYDIWADIIKLALEHGGHLIDIVPELYLLEQA
jgi:hypothetical protein